MTVHIGADVQSAWVHAVIGTIAKDSDIPQLKACLHGEERFIRPTVAIIKLAGLGNILRGKKMVCPSSHPARNFFIGISTILKRNVKITYYPVGKP